jgi:hypothetical protein
VRRGWPILILVLALPTGAAQALVWQDQVVPVNDDVIVYPNGTLTIGPGTVVTGTGHIVVWGSLVVEGDPARRAEIAVPILLLGNGTSTLEHARVWGVHGPAITLRNGTLLAHDAVLEADDVGLDAGHGAHASLADVTLRDNAGAALRVSGDARVEVARATLERNGRGVEVASGSLLVSDSIFRGDTPQVDVAWDGGALDATFLRNDLAALHPTGGPLVVLRDGNATGPGPTVSFAQDRLHDAAVAILVSGPGPALRSENDTIDANAVGLSLHAGTARLVRATLGNARNLEGADSGDVALENVTYLADAAATLPTQVPVGFPWAAVGLGAVVLAILGLVIAQPLVKRRLPQPPPGSPGLPPPPLVPHVLPALTPHEMRILRDVAANPGSAQAAIAARLGVTRQALHYHVKKLETKGLIVKVAKGRETRCHLAPGVAEALLSLE